MILNIFLIISATFGQNCNIENYGIKLNCTYFQGGEKKFSLGSKIKKDKFEGFITEGCKCQKLKLRKINLTKCEINHIYETYINTGKPQFIRKLTFIIEEIIIV